MSKNIKFKDINDKYSYGKYGDFKVIVMKKNGYINATKICNDAVTKNGTKKDFKEWKRISTAKEIMKEISSITGIAQEKLLISTTTGSNELRGTYAHPMLITNIAHWVSPQFACKISVWIEQWKKYSDDNTIEYYESLTNLVAHTNNGREKEIQQELQEKLGGIIEKPTKAGKIDLLTDNKLIEIKTYDNWKCALGQLNAYSTYYPQRKKYMYLFDVGNKDTSVIKKICRNYDIKIIIYD